MTVYRVSLDGTKFAPGVKFNDSLHKYLNVALCRLPSHSVYCNGCISIVMTTPACPYIRLWRNI